MSDSKTKIKEILAVMNVLYLANDSKKTLKINQYVSIINDKNIFGLDIDRRRVSQILYDLEAIYKQDGKLLPFFDLKETDNGRLYVQKADPKLVAKLLKALETSPQITEEESLEITHMICQYFTDNELEEIKLWK